ncbi:hypothetical protein [Sphingomonas alba]|uniref:DUF1049 domain-containing protein n=1 Tax=Sphingomonas alba TaxID=2908208 RepID=A0ABT0RPF5_9SPHN|nr:hypothetical protein [Sphingomonas alba]MCL6684475.1 hypothetical protein [Sphingomonas alba]
MRRINPGKAALSVGAVVGFYHLVWIVLVATGAAKTIMDFVLRLHFIQLQYEMLPFSPITALGLVALTFSVGAFFGLIFACIWNWLGNQPAAEAPEHSRA